MLGPYHETRKPIPSLKQTPNVNLKKTLIQEVSPHKSAPHQEETREAPRHLQLAEYLVKPPVVRTCRDNAGILVGYDRFVLDRLALDIVCKLPG
jgi:hypothetical protein